MKKSLIVSALASGILISSASAISLPSVDDTRVYVQSSSHEVNAPNTIGTLTVQNIEESSIGIGVTQYFLPAYLSKEDYKYFIDLNYNKTDDRKIAKLGLGIDKKLSSDDVSKPYVGFTIGTFKESWSNDPLVTVSNTASGADLDSKGAYIGAHIGVANKVDDKYSVDFFMDYTFIDNKKIITTASGGKDTIRENRIISVGLGLRF